MQPGAEAHPQPGPLHVPSFTEHLLNGRMDYFSGSSSTLTRTANTSYHQHVQQEHRVMGSSSLIRDYSTMMSGHGEYEVVGAALPFHDHLRIRTLQIFLE